MLTIIGLFPATYALNPDASTSLDRLPAILRQAEPLVTRYGDDEKQTALDGARSIEQRMGVPPGAAAAAPPASLAAGAAPPAASAAGPAQPTAPAASAAGPAQPTVPAASAAGPAQPTSPGDKGARTKQQKSNVRDDVYRVISQLKHAEDSKSTGAPEKKEAQRLSKELGSYVEYAPLWVRMLSALCLGVGTMIGYKRIVKTLGERLGNVHLTPAQGASAEVVSAVLIGTAGFTGLPVSTTHIVTSGIGGTMVAAGAGLRFAMIRRIVLAWVLTLPVTISVAGGLYYLLASPKF
jgi:PiT family inorganic phosphate transporter